MSPGPTGSGSETSPAGSERYGSMRNTPHAAPLPSPAVPLAQFDPSLRLQTGLGLDFSAAHLDNIWHTIRLLKFSFFAVGQVTMMTINK